MESLYANSDSRFYADVGARFDLTSNYCPNLHDEKGSDRID